MITQLNKRLLTNKILFFAIIGFTIVMLTLIIVIGQQLTQRRVSTGSNAYDNTSTRSACFNCEKAGGVEYCANRYGTFYQQYRSRYGSSKSERNIVLEAYWSTLKENVNTPQSEYRCGYCDVYPPRRIGSNIIGDNNINIDDVNLFSNICPKPTVYVSPIPSQLLSPIMTEAPTPNFFTQSMTFTQGWNHVSLYLDPIDPRLESVLSSLINIPNNEVTVWIYQDQAWKSWYSNGPVYLRPPTALRAGMGIDVNTKIGATISVSGSIPSTNIPVLQPNVYNYAGITRPLPITVEGNIINTETYPQAKIWRCAQGQPTGSCDLVYGPGIYHVTPYQLRPGEAYWIFLNPGSDNLNIPGASGN